MFGEFSGSNGLARAAIYDVDKLRAFHSDLRVVDIGHYLSGREQPASKIDQSFENVYFFCQPDAYDIVCKLLTPASISRAWRVGRWVWETPLFPDDWRFAEQIVHEVWAPSEFCASTFRSAVQIPVKLVPYAVTAPPSFDIDMRARLQISPDATMGLAVMDIYSCPERKNPWAHVQAWKSMFGHDRKAILVLKLRVSKRTKLVLEELRELIGDAPNVVLLTNELSHKEIAALHHAADIYLSLHRSEGFGLNIYEALLLGKIVLATDWSANAEYGPLFANYVPVPCKMIPYRDWSGHYGSQKFQWADPETDLAALPINRP